MVAGFMPVSPRRRLDKGGPGASFDRGARPPRFCAHPPVEIRKVGVGHDTQHSRIGALRNGGSGKCARSRKRARAGRVFQKGPSIHDGNSINSVFRDVSAYAGYAGAACLIWMMHSLVDLTPTAESA
jgi:hypothetical protein